MNPPRHQRAFAAGALLAAALTMLSACSTGPASPPPRYYRLPITPPVSVTTTALAPGAPVWQITGAVKLPEHLDREPMWLPYGVSGLQPLEGHRWAEPLRDGVPRVLRHDLELLRGPGSLGPTGGPKAPPARQLRIEVLAFEPTEDRMHVRIVARWSLVDPGGATVVDQATLEVASAASEPDALVQAHRLALWRLAERIVRGARPEGPTATR